MLSDNIRRHAVASTRSPKEASLSSTSLSVKVQLFVSLGRNHLLAAVETGRADVVTTMHFTGRRFDGGRRIR